MSLDSLEVRAATKEISAELDRQKEKNAKLKKWLDAAKEDMRTMCKFTVFEAAQNAGDSPREAEGLADIIEAIPLESTPLTDMLIEAHNMLAECAHFVKSSNDYRMTQHGKDFFRKIRKLTISIEQMIPDDKGAQLEPGVEG